MTLPMIRFPLAALALFAAMPAASQTADEAATVDRAMARAHRIYWYDQAAWHGTDAMLAGARDLADRIGGWIVDGLAEAAELIFYSRDADPVPLYLARFEKGKLTTSRRLGPDDTGLMTPGRRRLVAAIASARSALLQSGAQRCSARPFNTVALPPHTPDGPISVYFLTPQTEVDTIPMGGHYLFEVDRAGKAGPMRRFTTSCLAIASPGSKSKPVALTVSHMLDPVPTEIHGFSAMAARVPVIVFTPDKRMWQVRPAASGPMASLIGSD